MIELFGTGRRHLSDLGPNAIFTGELLPHFPPIIMVSWKMGSDRKMCGLSPNGLFSTSLIMGGRVVLGSKKMWLTKLPNISWGLRFSMIQLPLSYILF